jgi:hypothetical protein
MLQGYVGKNFRGISIKVRRAAAASLQELALLGSPSCLLHLSQHLLMTCNIIKSRECTNFLLQLMLC